MDQFLNRTEQGLSYRSLPAGGDAIRLIDFPTPSHGTRESGQDSLLKCSVNVYSFADRTAHYQDLTHEDRDMDEHNLRQLTAWGEGAEGYPYRYRWGDWLAMSHCWGDQQATEVISVNDKLVKISANIAAGLRAIAQLPAVRDGGLKLWNDFLCLDQQNIEEIERELKRIPRIYANAFSVVSWIGPAAAQSNLVMNMLQTKLGQLDGDRNDAGQILKSINRDEWRALSTMLVRRPYWRRMWITQEITLAGNRTLLVCGSDTAPLTRMWELVKAIIRNVGLGHRLLADALGTGDTYYDPTRDQTFFIIARLLYLHDIDQMRRSMLTDKDYDLLALLDVCRGSEQKYLRDKVYGVLGLLPSSVTSLIEPHLDKPLHEICTDLVIACMHALGRLDILQNCMYNTASPVFPTWTPDLSVADMSHALGTRAIMDAGGDLLSQPRISTDRRVMICRGFLVDTISHLTPPQWPLDPISQEEADDATAGTDITLRPRDTVETSLWRALVGGTVGFPHNRLPPSEYRQLLDLPWPDSHDNMTSREIAEDLIHNHNWCTPDEKQDMITFVTFRQRAGRAFSLAGHRLDSFFPSHHEKSGYLPTLSANDHIFADALPEDQDHHVHHPDHSPSTLEHTETSPNPKWHNRAMLRQACNTLKRRRLFVTSRLGLLGVCGRQARPGDVVAVLKGCSAPLILRQQQRQSEAHLDIAATGDDDNQDDKRIPGGEERYAVIGACYVEGLLHDNDEVHQQMQEDRDVVLV